MEGSEMCEQLERNNGIDVDFSICFSQAVQWQVSSKRATPLPAHSSLDKFRYLINTLGDILGYMC